MQEPGEGNDKDVTAVELLIALAKRKKQIAVVSLSAGLLALAGSFALPDFYKASSKLLPPQAPQSGAMALLSQIGGGGLAGGIAGLKNPNDLYIGMLKSRTVADRLIAKYELKKVYDTASHEDARRMLSESSLIVSGKDGIITIEVEGKDRQLVARLANSYADELLRLAGQLAITEASQRRMFFQRQLELSKDNLARAEVLLKKGLGTHGVVSVDGESRAIVETVGRLRALISAKEIQVDSMRAFVTKENPAFQRLAEELRSQRAELSKLENGRPSVAGSPTVSQEGLENIKLLRDVKYQQMLYELLAKQFELSRLDEAQEPSVIQVLDLAVEPERKFKPKRAIIAILATLLAGLVSVAWVFFGEVKRRMALSPEGAAQLAELKSSVQFR